MRRSGSRECVNPVGIEVSKETSESNKEKIMWGWGGGQVRWELKLPQKEKQISPDNKKEATSAVINLQRASF